MDPDALLQSRRVRSADLKQIRALLGQDPPWHRTLISRYHLLSVITRRLSGDWQDNYAHPIFVQRDCFQGTCYRAADWIPVGVTTGRGGNAPTRAPQGPPKEVFLKALPSDFRLPLLGP